MNESSRPSKRPRLDAEDSQRKISTSNLRDSEEYDSDEENEESEEDPEDSDYDTVKMRLEEAEEREEEEQEEDIFTEKEAGGIKSSFDDDNELFSTILGTKPKGGRLETPVPEKKTETTPMKVLPVKPRSKSALKPKILDDVMGIEAKEKHSSLKEREREEGENEREREREKGRDMERKLEKEREKGYKKKEREKEEALEQSVEVVSDNLWQKDFSTPTPSRSQVLKRKRDHLVDDTDESLSVTCHLSLRLISFSFFIAPTFLALYIFMLD